MKISQIGILPVNVAGEEQKHIIFEYNGVKLMIPTAHYVFESEVIAKSITIIFIYGKLGDVGHVGRAKSASHAWHDIRNSQTSDSRNLVYLSVDLSLYNSNVTDT